MIDIRYLLFVGLPIMVLGMLASFYVKSTFNKYARIACRSGLSGAQAAAEMLRRAGIFDVKIEQAHGFLSDHYDPSDKTLRLSHDVYSSSSLSAVGVACHEAGHAIQHAKGYVPLKFRSAMVPVTNLCSNLWSWVILAGCFLGFNMVFIKIGIAALTVSVIFSLVTLPVEWDASARAKVAMVNAGLVTHQESLQAGQVLNAAFLTYLVSAFGAIATLLYYLYRFGLLGGSDD